MIPVPPPSEDATLIIFAVSLLAPCLFVALLSWILCVLQRPEWSPEAEERAKVLLCALLTAEEQQQLAQDGYLVVRSPGVNNREYRIPAWGGHVYAYESGEETMALCLQPADPLPPQDVVLIHKLMIEGDEPRYLRQANVLWLRPGRAKDRNTSGGPTEVRRLTAP